MRPNLKIGLFTHPLNNSTTLYNVTNMPARYRIWLLVANYREFKRE